MNEEIFVCYSRSDAEIVLELVEDLREAGASVWIDQSGIDGALLWGQEIVEAILNCKVVIVAASEAAFKSPNVTKEICLASEEGKHILPLHLQPVQVPTNVRYQLAGIQHIEWFRSDRPSNWDALLRSLKRLGVTFSPSESGGRESPSSRPRAGREAAAVSFGVNVAGEWEGSWKRSSARIRHSGRMAIRQDGERLSATLTVTFEKTGVRTIVEERLTGAVTGSSVVLHGESASYIERGASTSYLLDNFELRLDAGSKVLEGEFHSKKGQGEARFRRVESCMGRGGPRSGTADRT